MGTFGSVQRRGAGGSNLHAMHDLKLSAVTREQLEAALVRQKTMRHLRLGDALVQANLVTAEQRDAALVAQSADRRKLLGEILVEQGLVGADDVRRVLVEHLGVPMIDLARFQCDADAALAMSADLARRCMAVPLYRSATRIAVGMENAVWWTALSEIENETGLKVDAAMARRADVLDFIARAYGEPEAAAAEQLPTAADGVEERLRVLSARVLTIQEEERKHISRDLHDDVGQSLTALKIGLHRLLPIAGAPAVPLLTECIAMADAALERVRQLAHEMRPPQLDELGLEEALRWLVERQRGSTGLDIKCHFNGLLGRRFLPEQESAAYRITQEALSNAARHAEARSILVAVEANANLLRVTIRDDGKGFDPSEAARRALRTSSLGLISMEERAKLAGGRLKVRSDNGQGTIIQATFTIAGAGGGT